MALTTRYADDGDLLANRRVEKPSILSCAAVILIRASVGSIEPQVLVSFPLQ